MSSRSAASCLFCGTTMGHINAARLTVNPALASFSVDLVVGRVSVWCRACGTPRCFYGVVRVSTSDPATRRGSV